MFSVSVDASTRSCPPLRFVFSIIFGNAAVSYFDQVNAGDSTERDDARALWENADGNRAAPQWSCEVLWPRRTQCMIPLAPFSHPSQAGLHYLWCLPGCHVCSSAMHPQQVCACLFPFSLWDFLLARLLALLFSQPFSAPKTLPGSHSHSATSNMVASLHTFRAVLALLNSPLRLPAAEVRAVSTCSLFCTAPESFCPCRLILRLPSPLTRLRPPSSTVAFLGLLHCSRT